MGHRRDADREGVSCRCSLHRQCVAATDCVNRQTTDITQVKAGVEPVLGNRTGFGTSRCVADRIVTGCTVGGDITGGCIQVNRFDSRQVDRTEATTGDAGRIAEVGCHGSTVTGQVGHVRSTRTATDQVNRTDTVTGCHVKGVIAVAAVERQRGDIASDIDVDLAVERDDSRCREVKAVIAAGTLVDQRIVGNCIGIIDHQ